MLFASIPMSIQTKYSWLIGAKRLQSEFPELSIFGETWVHGNSVQGFFTSETKLRPDFNTHLPAVTDYQLYYGITEALTQSQGWTSGLSRIYYSLAKDYIYKDPFRNVIFLDNHDLGRIFSIVKKDINKFKSGLSFLFTTRGTPMLYYGTELLMTGEGGAFGEGGRIDFPGGWPGDLANKFESSGRTTVEQEAFQFVQKLLNYRKATPALHRGKLMQFVPEQDIYVYFRYDDNTTVMVLMNSSDKPRQVRTARYQERMHGFTSAKDIISGEHLTNLNIIQVSGHSTRILELQQ